MFVHTNHFDISSGTGSELTTTTTHLGVSLTVIVWRVRSLVESPWGIVIILEVVLFEVLIDFARFFPYGWSNTGVIG